MKVFSVIMGLTKIEFSVYMVKGKYQARINDMVMFENYDYEMVRATLIDSLSINTPYVGLTH